MGYLYLGKTFWLSELWDECRIWFARTKDYRPVFQHRGDKGLVIWYDSVTREGKLRWQDALNVKNRCFFDACDGIFLNYTWKPEKHLEQSVIEAGERMKDVFVGVDVFGRNCFGGGGWNTRAAVREATSRGLSVAIFAQGRMFVEILTLTCE